MNNTFYWLDQYKERKDPTDHKAIFMWICAMLLRCKIILWMKYALATFNQEEEKERI